jgi:hypothetical protein
VRTLPETFTRKGINYKLVRRNDLKGVSGDGESPVARNRIAE